LRDPEKVAVTPVASTAERIAQRVIKVDRAAKHEILVEVLRNEPIDRVLVFTRTKHGADKVVRRLVQSGIPSEAIHGNKSQGQRERALSAFRDGKVKTLVATDIAARGIDVDGVSHVVNFDLPNVPETYVHRIGRTARAGAEGIAISLCDAEEAAFLRDIEKLIRISIPVTDKRTHPGHDEPQGTKQARSQSRTHVPGKHLPGNRGKNGRGPNGGRRSDQRGGGQTKDRHWHRGDKPRQQAQQGQANHGQQTRGHSNQNQPRDIASVAFLNAGAPADRS
jgi:ATP-dependent RNA helicase RhlE